MSEYQQPYLILWKGVSEALAEMKEQNYGLARSLLLKAQAAAEEAYICQPEDEKTLP
ncbi:MAG: hypothetical protein IJB35_00350 [Oscillospiraceae bacterium]|nr:hypothetical protein [Oscillospiraceae bacterium]